ncbi:MAG: type I restriction enzyme HsdR N-terminal domain-containing protein [Bacteroidales bacterium]|nr:type I restriction enzyme HsdR N-terminal domain-containing protein [Bacteroidales bacterium]
MPLQIYTSKNGKKEIFDPIRKKRVALTPEECVRQSMIAYLLHTLQVPALAISVEKKITYNGMTRRFDIVIFHQGKCLVIIECKAPAITLNPDTLFQASMYNSTLQARYIVLTNGKQNMVFRIQNQNYEPCSELPSFSEMIRNL